MTYNEPTLFILSDIVCCTRNYARLTVVSCAVSYNPVSTR